MSIVAMKLRNGSGAKGTQGCGFVKEQATTKQPTQVPEGAKQEGEIYDRWPWVEEVVWTERMLTALENGVKGGKWFSLIDKVYALPTLYVAFARVKSNKGAAGVDHQTIVMFERKLEENLQNLSDEIRKAKYRPAAVRRKWIDKPGSRDQRPLGIPTVRDRVAQAALRIVMDPIFERIFAPQSYGFRPQRGAKQALRRVDELLKSGYTYVVDIDLRSYFDTIPHAPLEALVAEQIADGRVLEMIGKFLKQGVMEELTELELAELELTESDEAEPTVGTPQGGVVSPLLANIYLNPLDHLMVARGREMVRYADDAVILCRSQDEAEAVLQELTQWTQDAGLQLHPEKTRVVTALRGFEFLGYHFKDGKRFPRKKSVKNLKHKIRPGTKRNSGQCLREIIKRVNRTLKGWFEYFKHSHKWAFKPLDQWLRMRLRSILRRRQKKRGRGRGSDHQRWPNAFFAAHGLFSLQDAHLQNRQALTR